MLLAAVEKDVAIGTAHEILSYMRLALGGKWKTNLPQGSLV